MRTKSTFNARAKIDPRWEEPDDAGDSVYPEQIDRAIAVRRERIRRNLAKRLEKRDLRKALREVWGD